MEQVVKNFISELGYSEPDELQQNRVMEWLQYYKGKTDKHTYYIYNGKKKNKKEMKSLNMPYMSCEDLSDFYFNEKLDITMDNEEVQNKIKECLEQNNFLEEANGLMQLTLALGTGAFITYLDNDVLKINYVPASNLIILDKDSILTYTISDVKGGKELYINAHILEENGYVIYNKKYIKKNNTNSYVEEEMDEKEERIETLSYIPKFAVIKTAKKNNYDINSPYGISIFANSLDTVLSIDNAYDSLDNEIAIGRKRIYIKGGAAQFNTDADGNVTPVFDSTDIAYYELPGSDKDEMIKESSFTLRIDELTGALQSQLNLYSGQLGLEKNHYEFKDGQVYVNTANVISSNSSAYRKIKKQENILTRAITELIYGIAELIGINTQFNVSVFYDDSIIEDTEQIRKQAQTEYNSNLISKAQYYRDVYKLGDEEAKQFAKQMNEEIQEETISDGSEFNITE